MINILVTGSNGQLGNCIKDIESKYANLNIVYTDYLELDICDLNQVKSFFQANNQIHYCINCAAYTAVDNAEIDYDKAFEINTLGAKNLALSCELNNAVLIHISTDFVFDGNKEKPYVETDIPNPISVYGDTKWKGEIEIQNIIKNHFIVRTSWLYSEHGSNFVKTMLRLSNERTTISVVNDQIGTPTYAGDLAEVIMHIIYTKSENFGVFHFSNSGEISWFDFAKAIFDEKGIKIDIKPIRTEDYPTPAKRPKFSVMDKSKINEVLKVEIYNWRKSLKKVLNKI